MTTMTRAEAAEILYDVIAAAPKPPEGPSLSACLEAMMVLTAPPPKETDDAE